MSTIYFRLTWDRIELGFPWGQKYFTKRAKPPRGTALYIKVYLSYLFVGAPVDGCLTGTPLLAPKSAASTLPLIRMTLVGSFVAFEVIVTDLLIGPILLVSYFTLIEDVAPGIIGSLSHLGTVHPQEPLHLVIRRGSVPVFVTINSQAPLAP